MNEFATCQMLLRRLGRVYCARIFLSINLFFLVVFVGVVKALIIMLLSFQLSSLCEYFICKNEPIAAMQFGFSTMV